MNRSGVAAVVLICVAGLATNALIYAPGLRYRPNNDFLGLYSGGRLAGSARIYDPEAVFAVQRCAVGFVNRHLLFVRPAFYAAFLWPLARLPFLPAYCLYQALLLAATAGFVWLFRIPSRRITLIACCWSMPLFGSFVTGQDIPVLLLAIAAALSLLRHKRDFQAGLAFSICAVKPHLFLLLPLFIVGRKAWRFAYGLALGGLLLMAMSFAAGGRHWLPAFIRVSTLAQVSPNIRVMPNLNALFGGTLAFELLGIIAVAVAVWLAVERGNLEWGFAATLAGGLLTSHHAYVADCSILLPALLIVRSQAQKRWQRSFALFLFTPLAYVGLFSPLLPQFTRVALLLLLLSFTVAPDLERSP